MAYSAPAQLAYQVTGFDEPGEPGIAKLFNVSSPDAFHNSKARYPPPKCLPGTRVALLKEVFDWIESSDQKILWISGPPGEGKSVIAQTVAEEYAQDHTLATFFFCGAHSRNTAERLILSIVYQLAIQKWFIRAQIENIVEENPSILYKPLKTLIETLILPLFISTSTKNIHTKPLPSHTSTPYLIIIDGLDECKGDNSPRDVVQHIGKLAHTNGVPLRFVIVSRPEHEIEESFNHLVGGYNRISLSDARHVLQASDDIRKYLQDRFDELWISEWITDDTISVLVNQARGEFNYAAAVLGYIGDSNFYQAERLSEILNTQPRLGHFRIFSSKEESASQWLFSSQEDLLKYFSRQEDPLDYVSNQNALTPDEKVLCSDWAKNGVIYERFTLYIYERLRAHVSPNHLAELKDCMRTWSTWDTIDAITQHHMISDRLRTFPVWSTEKVFRGTMDQGIIALDLDSICARLFLVLQDRKQYQRLLNLPEEKSQTVLNLLQTLLDSPSLDSSFRSPFMNALLRLAKKTSLYPEVLLKTSVTLEGEDAVASGHFGDVWKGTYEGQKVAVKVLKLYEQSDVMKHLKKVSYETLIWRQLCHINVLPFFCLYHVGGHRARIGLVSPWMKNGNVQQYLRRAPDVDRVSLVQDVAKGLEYLHTMQPSIVHGDLKAVNILITATYRACLADFGLSTASQSQAMNFSSSSTGRAGGTPRWTAPELLLGTLKINNISSDVYAFGCVLYEIFSGNIPFHDINSDYPVILKVIQGERPPRPSHCVPSGVSCDILGLDDHMWSITEDCWLADPAGRPTTSDIIARLPKRPIPTNQFNGIRQHSPDQDLISWVLSNRGARQVAAMPV